MLVSTPIRRHTCSEQAELWLLCSLAALLNYITVSGVFAAEAALTLLKDDVTAKKLGGGFMTPATLGQPYIDRLADAGFEIEVEMVGL